MLEVLLLVIGLLAGSITAFAIENRNKESKRDHRFRSANNMIDRIEEYWRGGIITDKEKESLLSPYINNAKKNVIPQIDLTPIKNELISLLDQKIGEINRKIDGIKIEDRNIKAPRKELREINRRSTRRSITPITKEESDEEELREIKKSLLDTLKRLEGSELE